MRLYLATMPEGWGHSRNIDSKYVSGNIMHTQLGKLNSKFRILISYWYYKNVDIEEMLYKYYTDIEMDIFADSGAFSAMTQGVDITRKEYADWVKRWEHLFTVYSNLDVIRNAEKTWENQQYMEDAGLKPLPVFHIAEKFDWLEKYIDNYNYIALGGLVSTGINYNKRMAWLVKCFRMANNKAVFHAFGVTTWEVMSSFMWYSVDSSSWGSGFRYGTISLFDHNKGKFNKLTLGDYNSCKQNAKLINSYGYDPMDFAVRERNDRNKVCAISALSYIKAEEYLRRRWGKVKLPGMGSGYKGYLADSGGLSLSSNYYMAKQGIKVYLG